jgi:hypothetical protein
MDLDEYYPDLLYDLLFFPLGGHIACLRLLIKHNKPKPFRNSEGLFFGAHAWADIFVGTNGRF